MRESSEILAESTERPRGTDFTQLVAEGVSLDLTGKAEVKVPGDESARVWGVGTASPKMGHGDSAHAEETVSTWTPIFLE